MKNQFNYKQRLGAFITVLCITLLGLFLVKIGVLSMINYFEFPQSFIFTSSMMFAVLGPFIFIPMIILAIPIITVGKRLPLHVDLFLNKSMLYGLVFVILITILFKFFYQYTLNEKDYIACKGIPSGYMLGMGKQYVKDIDLCEHNLERN